MTTTPPPPPWTTEIGLRMRRHFLLKLFGTTAFVWAFFVGYFYLLRHPAHPVFVMPLLAGSGMGPASGGRCVPTTLVPTQGARPLASAQERRPSLVAHHKAR